MSGHDIIGILIYKLNIFKKIIIILGIAKTGSGKTYAYVWPLLVHILD